MLVTEHAKAALNPAGWRVAAVVLRYFVAVRLAPDTSRVALSGPWAQHLREAHRERGSLGAGRGPASLGVRNSAADSNHTMGTERVLVLCLPKAWGPGAVRRVAARPLPLVPRVCLGIELRSRCHFKSSLPTAPSALRCALMGFATPLTDCDGTPSLNSFQ